MEILLLAFGDHTYIKWAFNLALSIKRFNPDIKIRLLYEQKLLEHLEGWQQDYFDFKQPIAEADLYVNGRLTPEKIKTSYYKYIVSEHTIYLDVDAVALKDIAPLFDDCINTGKYYLTQIHSTHTLAQGRGKIDNMAWATAGVVWDHYKLSEDAVFPATQSSFAYIRKCAESEELFKRMQENLRNAIPLECLAYKWGGGMPDELILNVTLAQLGIIPQLTNDPIFFSTTFAGNAGEIYSHYLMGLFGAKGMTSTSVLDWYDRLMHQYCREHYGINHLWKAHQLMKNKFAAKK